MTRDDLISIARRLEVDASEAELDDLLDQLVRALPNSQIGDLLFHNTPHLSAEEAIDEALRQQKNWDEQSRN